METLLQKGTVTKVSLHSSLFCLVPQGFLVPFSPPYSSPAPMYLHNFPSAFFFPSPPPPLLPFKLTENNEPLWPSTFLMSLLISVS